MGFDIKRFRESDIREEFICPICCDLLEDPVLFELCEHVFCRKCIEEWLEKGERQVCPIDRQEVSDKSLRPPQRSFRNLITNLMISCDFSSNGCQEYVKIEELSVHSSNCPFNPVIMNQDIECPSNCGAIVKRCGSIDEHNCVVHLNKIIVSKNDVIQQYFSKNSELETENNRLKNECNDFKIRYEEVIKHLDQITKQNENLSLELSTNNEMINDFNFIIDLKDKSIEGLNVEIEKLKKEIQRLLNITINNVNEVNSGNASNDINNESSDLICLQTINTNENQNNDSKTETIESIETSLDNRKLVETLLKKGYLKNDRVIRAMLSIDRGLFAPSAASYALHHIRPIGHGAHTGPATYEATILQFLETHFGNNCKVLNVGSGTGYLTSCIAKMIEPNGRVIGIEHIPQLVRQSVETIDKYYPLLRESAVLKIIMSDGRFGYPSEAPYDLIFVEPLTRRVPQKLTDQLKLGGHIIVPIGSRDKDINLEMFTKQMSGDIVRQILCDDWKLMQENTLDLLEDKKLQLRTGWRVKLGF